MATIDCLTQDQKTPSDHLYPEIDNKIGAYPRCTPWNPPMKSLVTPHSCLRVLLGACFLLSEPHPLFRVTKKAPRWARRGFFGIDGSADAQGSILFTNFDLMALKRRLHLSVRLRESFRRFKSPSVWGPEVALPTEDDP